jgi:hypothetical protein
MRLRVALVFIVIIIVILILFYVYNEYIRTVSEIDIDLEAKKTEVTQEIKNFRLKRLIKQKDLTLRKEDFALISQRQKYVTPTNNVVSQYILSNQITTIKDAYAKAVSWIWVSDQTLHGEQEKWLLPEEFIQDTSSYATNPILENMVSDCESQAYTLVSIIEATGIPKQNVRVALGEVNFAGEIGGHAWVEVYENDEWYQLEATSGPFWDDDENQLVNNTGFPYTYFKNHPYPVEEYWAFFNDRYYYNPHSGRESTDLPPHWYINPILLSNQ